MIALDEDFIITGEMQVYPQTGPARFGADHLHLLPRHTMGQSKILPPYSHAAIVRFSAMNSFDWPQFWFRQSIR